MQVYNIKLQKPVAISSNRTVLVLLSELQLELKLELCKNVLLKHVRMQLC